MAGSFVIGNQLAAEVMQGKTVDEEHKSGQGDAAGKDEEHKSVQGDTTSGSGSSVAESATVSRPHLGHSAKDLVAQSAQTEPPLTASAATTAQLPAPTSTTKAAATVAPAVASGATTPAAPSVLTPAPLPPVLTVTCAPGVRPWQVPPVRTSTPSTVASCVQPPLSSQPSPATHAVSPATTAALAVRGNKTPQRSPSPLMRHVNHAASMPILVGMPQTAPSTTTSAAPAPLPRTVSTSPLLSRPATRPMLCSQGLDGGVRSTTALPKASAYVGYGHPAAPGEPAWPQGHAQEELQTQAAKGVGDVLQRQSNAEDT